MASTKGLFHGRNVLFVGETMRNSRGGRKRSCGKVIMFLMVASNALIATLFLGQMKFNACEPPKRNPNPFIEVNNTRSRIAGGDEFSLARSQSFGFFYDISDEYWLLWQKIFLEHENHRYPDNPLTFNPRALPHQADPELYSRRNNHPGYNSYAAWYQNNYEPNFSCPFERRLGVPMNGDGPKWVCDPHRIKKLAEARKERDPTHPCVVYSIGSNGDFTFEMGMQKTVGAGVCEFHIFDMADHADAIPSELQRAHYHQWGLEKQMKRKIKKPGEEYYGLLDTVEMLGHKDLDVIDIFKIDCEHCEWGTYKDWLSDEIPMLHQIQVELHWAPTKEDAGAMDLFDSFERAGYLRFHKEPNIQWGPECIEYAFVKMDKAFVDVKTNS